VFCHVLLDELDRLPGDSRMQIGFIAFDSLLYFYGLDPSFPQPKMFIISDLDGQLLCSCYDPSVCLNFFFRNVNVVCHGTCWFL